MASRLEFRIHSVKCVDETNGSFAERFGNDEIFLGGHNILQNGETAPIRPRSIYPHFDDGDIKVFEPPMVFHTFALGNAYPQEFGIGMTLIEQDQGGMVDAVTVIANRVEEEVKKRLPGAKAQREADAARAAAASAGAAPAVLAPILKYALSAAAPAIIDWVKKKFIGAFADDVFQPQHAVVAISSASHAWSGSATSARSTARASDHQGTYEIVYDWKLV